MFPIRRHPFQIGRWLITACTIASPMVAGAEERAEAFAPAVEAGDIIGLGASLVMVIAAVLVVGWLYTRSQSLRRAGSNVIRILAAQPLGSKERIVLVDVGGTQLVLGMTSAQVQTLHVFEEPVLIDSAERIGVGAFGERLRKFIKGQGS